ncbi:MAG: hypothetical protein WEA28_12390 [Xanthobacteraceae bacterium]
MADFVERNFSREVELLKALVRVPSDNPPGDCARHAEAAAKLFEGSASRSSAIRYRLSW